MVKGKKKDGSIKLLCEKSAMGAQLDYGRTLQNNSLKSSYPRLYFLSLDQGKTVGKVRRWEDGRWRWWFNWRRNRYDWELNMEEDLFSSPSMGVICQDVHDDLVWRGDPKVCSR